MMSFILFIASSAAAESISQKVGNQNSEADVNSTGIPCKSQSDCPSLTTCHHGTCWFGDSSAESPEQLADQSGNNVSSTGMHCKWQTDCPDITTCCNKPNGGKGTCWFGGTCDVYCDTDDHCVGQMTCYHGKCCNPYKDSCSDSNNIEAGANSSGTSCTSQSDCPPMSTCRNGTCWLGDSSGESSTESSENVDTGSNNLDADVNSTGTECKSSSDCPLLSHCYQGTCWFGDRSTESPEHLADQRGNNNLEADANSSGIPCKSQSDCPATSTCRNGTCWLDAGNSNLDADVNATGRHHCYMDLDCPPGGYQCVNGICRIGTSANVNSSGCIQCSCKSSSDCPATSTCRNGICLLGDSSTESSASEQGQEVHV